MTKSARSTQPKQPTLKSRKRPGGDYFYACIGGQQHGFGFDRQEAQRLFALKLAEHLNPPAEKPRQPERPLLVREVLTRFLQWVDIDPEKKDATRDMYRDAIVGRPKSDKPKSAKAAKAAKKRKSSVPFLEWLDKKHPDLLVSEFGPMLVHQWIKDEFDGRKKNYHMTLMRPVKAAFNWAAEQPEFESRMPRNPLKGLKIQKSEPRKKFMTDEQWAQIKANATGPFLDFITVVAASGARVQEIRKAQVSNLDHEQRSLYFESQVKETGNEDPREILLDDEAYAICKRLAEQWKTGNLFRNAHGRPWTKDAICCRYKRLREKLNFEFNATLLRHRFCQTELERGTPETELQHLMGHKDGRMISSTYNKWASRRKKLRENFDKRRSA